MKTILWLPSWYPNKTDPFDGDFIQRMARATAMYERVFVIYVTGSEAISKQEEVETNQQGNLHEMIVYYRYPSLLKKLFTWRSYFRLYKKYIDRFIEQHGKPDCVHVQVPIKAGMVALKLERKYGIPFVLTEHYGIYNNVLKDRFDQRSFYFRFFTRKVIEHAKTFMTVSKKAGEAINDMVVKKDFVVVPNTVDISLFFYKPAAGAVFRFLHVSNMAPLKN